MLVDLLFPNRCLHCSTVTTAEEPLCAACMRHIRFTNQEWEAGTALTERCRTLFPVRNAYALMYFEPRMPSRQIIHELKYRKREKIGGALAAWTTARLTFGNDAPQLFTTVPLHPRKEKERGYNQLHRYGDALAAHYQIPCDHGLLRRNYYRKPQALSSRRHRASTDKLFSVEKAMAPRHIALIDDVFTTGNTLAAAAEPLMEAGHSVSILVMAVERLPL